MPVEGGSLPRLLGRWIRGTLVAGLAGWLLVVALPAVTGAGWSAVRDSLFAVPPRWLAALVVVWAAGLLIHTTTLRAALPGLSSSRALMLSLTGSAVANVLPVGGAMGVVLNHRMTRSWGHDKASFAAYTIITNVWDVAVKLVVAVIALPLALRALRTATGVLPVWTLVTACGAVAVLLLLVLVGLRSGDGRLSGLADRIIGGVLGSLGEERADRLRCWVIETRHRCRDLVSAGWGRLTVGMVGYTLSLAVLFAMTTVVAGVGLSMGLVMVCFGVERVLTLAGLTPGGAGVVEAGVAAVMTALGGAAAPVVTAVLLYRAFTWALEIPVGVLGIVGWLFTVRTRYRDDLVKVG